MGLGNIDIYIAYKTNTGIWTSPVKREEHINTNVDKTCPPVSPDGKFIFFSRYNYLNEKTRYLLGQFISYR